MPAVATQSRIEALEDEAATWRERYESLKRDLDEMAATIMPQTLHLTRTEARLLALLYRHPMVTREVAFQVLYGNRVHDDELPDIKILDVFVCKLRAKLKLWRMSVETIYAQGFAMPRQSKEILRRLIEAEKR